MNQKEQINAFAKDVQNIIDRYRQEFDLSYASAIGVLAIIEHEMATESLNSSDDE